MSEGRKGVRGVGGREGGREGGRHPTSKLLSGI